MRQSQKEYLQRLVRRIFPILTWLPYYTRGKLRADVIAGISVGLVTVAHGVALGTIAGVPPQYGLYSAFPAGIMYFFFGTAKDMHIGPTVLQAILTSRYVPSSNPIIASALALCSGFAMFMIGTLNLGGLMSFISYPVVGGFVSAAALVITVSQVKYLVGISCPRQTAKCFVHLLKNIGSFRLWECMIGLSSLAILTALQFCRRYVTKPLPHDASRLRRIARSVFWFIVVARSAIVPVLAIILCYSLSASGHDVFITPKSVPKGLPGILFPLKEITLPNNSTISATKMLGDFSTGLLVVPLLAILEHIAVAKALSTQNKYKFHASQELMAVGLGNMFVSLLRGFPVTGSFGRSAISSASGSATPVTGLVTSILVILALWLIAPVFGYIPLSVLAAVVISACLSMIDLHLPLRIWKTNRVDIIPYAVAFLMAFYELEYGIFAGIAVSMIILLKHQTSPLFSVDSKENGTSAYIDIHLSGRLLYPAAEKLAASIENEVEKYDALKTLHIDCSRLDVADFTVFHELSLLKCKLQSNQIETVFVNCDNVPMKRFTEKVPPDTELGNGSPSDATGSLINTESGV